MAADDLVEALAGERLAAEVHEQLRHDAAVHERRAAALEVDADGLDRRAADGHHALLRALAARAQDGLLHVEVGHLDPDRLRGPQPAGVHQLEQRAVAQRGGRGALRLGEQLRHLAAVQDLRQPAAAAGAADRGGRVGVAQALAPEVAVERAQAGGLAVDRGGRRRRAAVALGQLGEEVADVGGGGDRRLGAAGLEEAPELEQVAAVRLERVARQAALELEVGEEVEHEVLVGAGVWERCDGGHGQLFRPAPAQTLAVKQPSQRTTRPLGSAVQPSRAPERSAASQSSPTSVFASRQSGSSSSSSDSGTAPELDALVLVALRLRVVQVGGQVDVDLLVGEARRRVARGEVTPLARPLADLLRELALGGRRAGSPPPRRACRRAAPAAPARPRPRAPGPRGRSARRRAPRSQPTRGGSTISRSTSSPSSKRKRSSRTVTMRPLHISLLSIRSKLISLLRGRFRRPARRGRTARPPRFRGPSYGRAGRR